MNPLSRLGVGTLAGRLTLGLAAAGLATLSLLTPVSAAGPVGTAEHAYGIDPTKIKFPDIAVDAKSPQNQPDGSRKYIFIVENRGHGDANEVVLSRQYVRRLASTGEYFDLVIMPDLKVAVAAKQEIGVVFTCPPQPAAYTCSTGMLSAQVVGHEIIKDNNSDYTTP
jgi:hypothetical protein